MTEEYKREDYLEVHQPVGCKGCVFDKVCRTDQPEWAKGCSDRKTIWKKAEPVFVTYEEAEERIEGYDEYTCPCSMCTYDNTDICTNDVCTGGLFVMPSQLKLAEEVPKPKQVEEEVLHYKGREVRLMTYEERDARGMDKGSCSLCVYEDADSCEDCDGGFFVYCDEYPPIKEVPEEETPAEEPLDRQSHYNLRGGIEAVDFGAKHGITFCQGNALKYVYRHPFKGSGKKDLGKAIVYTKWIKEKELKEIPKISLDEVEEYILSNKFNYREGIIIGNILFGYIDDAVKHLEALIEEEYGNEEG